MSTDRPASTDVADDPRLAGHAAFQDRVLTELDALRTEVSDRTDRT